LISPRGDDPTKTPLQGKIHSPSSSTRARFFFGAHPADYGEKGMAAFAGSHLMGQPAGTNSLAQALCEGSEAMVTNTADRVILRGAKG